MFGFLVQLSFQSEAKGGRRPIFGDDPRFYQTLSDNPYFSELKSCYRWMGKVEKSRWLRGKVHMSPESLQDFLHRTNRQSQIIYCWKNPIGAMMGRRVVSDQSFPYSYGENLMRIDFVEDPVFYFRNTRQYFHRGLSDDLPKKYKKDVDSEIVYAAYAHLKNPEHTGFHEYTIRRPEVIRGWTFNDPELQQQFRHHYLSYQRGEFDFWEMHFPSHWGEDYYWKEIEARRVHQAEVWADESSAKYFVNPKARAGF